MRQIAFVIVLVVFSLTMQAQKITQGSLDFMRQAQAISIEFVFDQATVFDRNNMTIEEWGEIHESEVPSTPGRFMNQLRTAQGDQMRMFAGEANKKIKGVKFGWKNTERIHMLCKMKSVNHRGQNADADYIFTDTQTGEVLAVVNMKCKGGKVGTFINLLGDSFHDAFGKVIKLLAKARKGE